MNKIKNLVITLKVTLNIALFVALISIIAVGCSGRQFFTPMPAVLPPSPSPTPPVIPIPLFNPLAVTPLIENIYFNQINLPTQWFTAGIQSASGPLLVNGTPVTEAFGLHMDANIMLNSSDTAGEYQFSILSDDGSMLYLGNSNADTTTAWWTKPGSVAITVDNDLAPGSLTGGHPDILQCSTTTLNLSVGVPVPLHIDYFQGPPNFLGIMVLWRLVPTNSPNYINGSITDDPCGRNGNDTNYFVSTAASPSPTPAAWYTEMTTGNVNGDGNWAPIPSKNYYLQNGTSNPCVKSQVAAKARPK